MQIGKDKYYTTEHKFVFWKRVRYKLLWQNIYVHITHILFNSISNIIIVVFPYQVLYFLLLYGLTHLKKNAFNLTKWLCWYHVSYFTSGKTKIADQLRWNVNIFIHYETHCLKPVCQYRTCMEKSRIQKFMKSNK